MPRRGLRISATTRLAATLAVAVSLLGFTATWAAPRRPRLSRQEPAIVQPGRDVVPVEGRDLLEEPPFDRLVLIDDTVLLIEPISPRPLPDPEIERRKQLKAATESKGKGIFGKLPEQVRREDDRASMIAIHTVPPEVADYLVKPLSIKRVDYFEDFLLAEAERRARSGDFERAFEHLLAVQSRDANWPGLKEKTDRIVFLEGQAAVRTNDGDRGLRLLGELYSRRPDYPDLAKQLGEAYANRIAKAIELGAFQRGRLELKALAKLAPDHPEVERSRTQIIGMALEVARDAEALGGADAAEGLADALAVWPDDPDLAARFEKAFTADPVLDVAVDDLPRNLGPWHLTSADRRVSRLLYQPILADDSEEAARGERSDQVASEVTTGDLGRRVSIRVRSDLAWNDGSRSVAAVDLARTLTDRALPSSLVFDARWADLVDQVSIRGQDEVELRFSRAPLDHETLLLGPVGPAHAGRDGRVWTPEGTRLLGTGPFRPVHERSPVARFDRLAHTSAPGPTISRIRERRFADPLQAVDAILRGEVTALESVPPQRLGELRADAAIHLGRSPQVAMHWIALDGRNPVLRNRSLRRALACAVDRSTLLEESILRGPIEGDNALSDGPTPKGSYADAPNVEPLAHDLLLARMLVAAGRKELGGEPIKLTFAYPEDAVANTVVPLIAEIYRTIGLEVAIAAEPRSTLEGRLRAGDRFDLAYRIGTIDEPVRDVGPMLCPGYDARTSADGLGALVSPRMLQLLLQLDQAQDWPTARGLVTTIDRESRDELPIIPLWQLERHYAWRDRLTGPAESAARFYDGIESWRISPWFARDPE